MLVVFVDVLGHTQSHAKVFFYKQVHTFAAVLHTSRGVDTRTNLEDDIAHRQLAVVESTDVDDGFESYAWVLVELLQTVEGEDAVLVDYGHDVGSDAYGTEVE